MRAWGVVAALIGALGLVAVWAPPAVAEGPIKIGFGMALTGGGAGNGKAALVAMQIWAEEVNKKGGLLGRKVELVYYDDQSRATTVPDV